MPYTPAESRRVSIGNAINAAATLYSNQSDPTVAFTDNLDTIIAYVLEAQEKYALTDEEAAVSNVVRAFPGSQVLPTPAQAQGLGQLVGSYQEAAHAPKPAQIPGQTQATVGSSKKDQAWLRFFNAPKEYWDNRVDKKNPSAPDFKHKQSGDGLWIGGQYPAPDWVIDRLRTEGYLG